MNALDRQTPYITDIQRFSTKDGDGIRTTVFLKGCPLSCRWCHNPETMSAKRELIFNEKQCVSCGNCQSACPLNKDARKTPKNCLNCFSCVNHCPTNALKISGRTLTAKELAENLLRDAPFYGDTGGVTFSGGEPLLYPDYILECAGYLKGKIPTLNIDTSGYVPSKNIAAVADVTDLLLYDIKDTDKARLKQNTGADYDTVIENLLFADGQGIKTRLRLLIIRNINDNIRHINRVKQVMRKLKHCTGADILEYHPYMESKYDSLGKSCDFLSEQYIPDKETLSYLNKVLNA